MTFLIDIIIVAILGLTVFFAVKNGFVKTAVSACSFILAIIVTVSFSSPFSAYIKEEFVLDTVEDIVTDKLEGSIVEGSLRLEQVLDGQSEKFNDFIDVTGIDLGAVKTWFNENIANTDDATSALAHKIADQIADTVSSVIAVAILFIGTQILLSVAGYFLNKLAKLPVIRSCNKLLGLILGIVLGFLRVFLFCFIMKMLIENGDFLGSDFLTSLDPDSSLLFNWFYNLEIFSFLV